MTTRCITQRIPSIIVGALLIGYLSIMPFGVVAQNSQPTGVANIAWSPDGSQLATGDIRGNVAIWDPVTGQALQTFLGHQDAIATIAWSPDGSKLVSGSYDKTARIWDTNSGKVLFTFTGHTDATYFVAWNQDGSQIITISGGEQPMWRTWDAKTGRLLDSHGEGMIGKMLWNQDHTKLAISYVPGAVLILENNKPARTILFPEGSDKNYDPLYNITTVAWSPDSNQIATGSLNGVIRIWDIATSQVLATFQGSDSNEVSTTTTAINSVAFNADGSHLFSISADGTMRVWNTVGKQVLGTIHISPGKAAWSLYSGRLALAVNTQVTLSRVQSLADGAVQIVVPFPSLDQLQVITKRCVSADVQQTLTSRIDRAKLPDFITEVNKLPTEQVPPACAADLIAVAEALQKQP
jgi:WD40 repeat protein